MGCNPNAAPVSHLLLPGQGPWGPDGHSAPVAGCPSRWAPGGSGRLREQLRDEPGLAEPLLPDWLKADSGGRAHRAFDWSFQGPGVRVPGPRPSWGTLEAGVRGGYVCG